MDLKGLLLEVKLAYRSKFYLRRNVLLHPDGISLNFLVISYFIFSKFEEQRVLGTSYSDICGNTEKVGDFAVHLLSF